MTVIDNIIEKIETFNEENDLQHGNAETIFEEQQGVLTTIEGTNHTTLTVAFSMDDIEEIERNDTFLNVLERNYTARINDFDVDEEFTMLWSQDFGEHNGFTVRGFINVLEDDAEHFNNIQYS
ncbi:hypothetical protein [Staphylococcus equorum]|uniref:hypothetical protein n=1 Tax=Staphylococcus equorum TaxID=246432 RepID=UPI003FD782FB